MNECHIIEPRCSLETCLGNTASSPFPAKMNEIRTWIEAFLGAKCGNALSSKASNLFYVRISFHMLETLKTQSSTSVLNTKLGNAVVMSLELKITNKGGSIKFNVKETVTFHPVK